MQAISTMMEVVAMMQLILKFKIWLPMLILMANRVKPLKTTQGNLYTTKTFIEIISIIIENQTTKNVGNKIKVPTGLMTIGMMAPAAVWAIVSGFLRSI